jgi:hypothetical protein
MFEPKTDAEKAAYWEEMAKLADDDNKRLRAEIGRLSSQLREGIKEVDGKLTVVWTEEELEQAQDRAEKTCEAFGIKRSPTRAELLAEVERLRAERAPSRCVDHPSVKAYVCAACYQSATHEAYALCAEVERLREALGKIEADAQVLSLADPIGSLIARIATNALRGEVEE